MPRNLTKDQLQWKREVYADLLQWIEENDISEQSYHWDETHGFPAWPWDRAAEYVVNISRLTVP
jgi:hypothetical protein